MADNRHSRPSLATQENQAQIEILFNSIGDGVIVVDEFGKVMRINKVALNILGYREKDLLGEWFPEKIVPLTENGEAIGIIDRPIAKTFLTGKPVSEKVYYRRKDGTIVPVANTLSPVMLGRKPVGAILVFRDITLESDIDRMKSEFISLASHQLRTPLSSIKTYSHMLIEGYMGELTPTQKDSLQTIIKASNRMNTLIGMLLNVTRIESGKVTVTLKNTDLGKLVNEVVKEHELEAVNKNIALLAKLPSKGCTLKTDALLIKEALSNLISNALKYTEEGGAVTVTLKRNTGAIVFSVKDTGLGIPEYSQDQIFSKFFRAHNVVRQETTGTGLGLYLVKGLIDRLGGKIWFKSREGGGSTFSFSLPTQTKPPKHEKLPKALRS